MHSNKKMILTALIGMLSVLLLSSLISAVSGKPGKPVPLDTDKVPFKTDNLSGNITYLVDNTIVDTIKAGQDFSTTVFVKNEENTKVSINLTLSSKGELDKKTIDNLSYHENKTATLSGRAGEAGTIIKVMINGNSVHKQKITPSVKGFSLTVLIAAIVVLFVVGIVLGYKVFGGRGGGPPIYMAPTKISSSESANARGGATKDLSHADSLLSEARDAGADVSTEEELMRAASTFHKRAEEEHSDDRFDSAYAYAEGASILGQSISSSIEKKRKAAEEGESDIAAAEDAIKDVKKNMKEAKDRGIDVGPSTSLNKLASQIIKSAPKAEDPEVYSFQAETARRIAEHANESLESSISGQEDRIKRTEERIGAADDALDSAGELIEKRRDEFDTLVPEYWQKVAEEIRNVADDKELNAEVREAMADTTIRICEWIEGMFERRDLRSRMKGEGGGGIIRR